MTVFAGLLFVEKPTCSKLVKKFPAFYGLWRFVTSCTIARLLSLPWATQWNVLSLKTADQTRKWKMHCLMYRLYIVKMENFYFERCRTVHVPSMSLIVSPSTGKYELGNTERVDRVSRLFFKLPYETLFRLRVISVIYSRVVRQKNCFC
jgi:hypothetical protein